MIVLAVGLLGLAATVPMMKSDLVRSDRRTRATFLAEESVEWLRGLAYADSALIAGTHEDGAYDEPGYALTWTVENDVPSAGIKRITVSVDREQGPDDSATIVFLHAEAGR